MYHSAVQSVTVNNTVCMSWCRNFSYVKIRVFQDVTLLDVSQDSFVVFRARQSEVRQAYDTCVRGDSDIGWAGPVGCTSTAAVAWP